jgi:hypothetical protein
MKHRRRISDGQIYQTKPLALAKLFNEFKVKESQITLDIISEPEQQLSSKGIHFAFNKPFPFTSLVLFDLPSLSMQQAWNYQRPYQTPEYIRNRKHDTIYTSFCLDYPSSTSHAETHLLGVLGPEGANSLSGPPYLQLVNLLKLRVVLLTVVGLRVVLQATLGLATVGNSSVEVVEDGLKGGLEAWAPVEGTTAGGGGAGGVHVVHAVGADQGVQRLCSLLDSLVESLRGAVAALTEDFVLGEEHAVDTAHQAATLTVQVGVDLLLEGGLVHVSGTDGNTEGDSLLLGLAGDILEDGDG